MTARWPRAAAGAVIALAVAIAALVAGATAQAKPAQPRLDAGAAPSPPAAGSATPAAPARPTRDGSAARDVAQPATPDDAPADPTAEPAAPPDDPDRDPADAARPRSRPTSRPTADKAPDQPARPAAGGGGADDDAGGGSNAPIEAGAIDATSGAGAPATEPETPAAGSADAPPPPPPAPPPPASEPEETDSGPPAQAPEITAAAAEPPPTTERTTENTLFAIKVIVGLVVLLVLAYLGGHRRVVRFQEQLGIGGVITAGFPFVALGLIASAPQIGILDETVLRGLRPVLQFGLGWLGFIVGAQLDIRVLDRVPKGTAYMILVEAFGPFAFTFAGCGAVLIAFGASPDDPAVWRDLVLLGAAAAMTAPRKFRSFASRAWREGRPVDVLLAQLDELAGVIGLLFITAYFREAGASRWELPGTAWVFVALGLGVAIGVLIFAMIRVPRSNAEFLAVVLGSIAFASGIAGYLRLSPIVVCFLAGVLVTNFPNDQRDAVFRILAHLERPVQLLFLIVAGAVWDPSDWRGWALVPLFVAARIVGRWTGMIASRTVVGMALPLGYADQRVMIVPVSSLSIALVISVESIYQDTALPWVTTAVIGGAIVSELVLRRERADTHAEDAIALAPPIDELDDETPGPVYREDSAPHSGGHEP